MRFYDVYHHFLLPFMEQEMRNKNLSGVIAGNEENAKVELEIFRLKKCENFEKVTNQN